MNRHDERQCRLLIATVVDLIDIIAELLTDSEHKGKTSSAEPYIFIAESRSRNECEASALEMKSQRRPHGTSSHS